MAKLVRGDGTPIRAVVADDEVVLADLLRMALSAEGWEVRTAHNGQAALTAIREMDPDVAVLDIMMPGIDGMEVLKRLRETGSTVPVLFLTAKDAVADRVSGIELGADDYVTKPFSLDEVVARLRGIVRRNCTLLAEASPTIEVGDLVMNTDTYEVSRAGTAVTLTATEFELLRYLMENPRRVLTKAQLLDRVWSYDFNGKASVVELYISYLRKKIDTLGPPMIHTVRGVGYALRPAQ